MNPEINKEVISSGPDLLNEKPRFALSIWFELVPISKRIISLAENNKFELVESMIENMAEIILNEYNIQQITISISKPGAIRGSEDVGIEITRPWTKDLMIFHHQH